MVEPIAHVDAVEVRYYPRDGSVFLDTHYLIKGVAGAIFWKLAREHALDGRSEFSVRELRLAGHELRLPDVQDNLGVRLLLLQRRLAERGAALQIHRTGRGRFRIDLHRPLRLVAVPDPQRVDRMGSPPPDQAQWTRSSGSGAKPSVRTSPTRSVAADLRSRPPAQPPDAGRMCAGTCTSLVP